MCTPVAFWHAMSLKTHFSLIYLYNLDHLERADLIVLVRESVDQLLSSAGNPRDIRNVGNKTALAKVRV